MKYKALTVGIVLSSAGLFFPWYSDVDSFSAGVVYNGIDGPTGLIGLSILFLNIVTLSFFVYAARFKREPMLPISRPGLEKYLGAGTIYMSVLMMSIFYHSDFGLNAASKSLGWGAYVSLAGMLIITYAGVVLSKQEFSHVNPEIVEDVIVEENLVAQEQWRQQQELAKAVEPVAEDAPLRSDPQTINVHHKEEPQVSTNHMIRTDL